MPATPLDPSTPATVPAWRRRGTWLIVAAAALCAFVGWKVLTWPDVASLATRNPATTAFIERYRKGERGAGRPDAVAWTWVPDGRISPHLKRAVLCSEDLGFFSHDGFEPLEIRKAIEEAWAERRMPRGASTITQQVAKNLWLSPSRNPVRKVEEALLTRQLERDLGKRRILEIYLNVAEFGSGVYGAEAAAHRYFGKSAADLGEEESAELAAALPKPSKWHPGSGSLAAARRARVILGRMAQAQWLWKEI